MHLDIERERKINAALRRLSITRVSIAHRPEMAEGTDLVRIGPCRVGRSEVRDFKGHAELQNHRFHRCDMSHHEREPEPAKRDDVMSVQRSRSEESCPRETCCIGLS